MTWWAILGVVILLLIGLAWTLCAIADQANRDMG
jgi:hypothetical protein